MSWFIDDPKRWESELESLKAIGVKFDIAKDVQAAGFIRLKLILEEECSIPNFPPKFLPLELTVIYPASYPYFRPDVYAPGISLARHQNVISKNLCLLPRQTSFWLPETTIGQLLSEQLPKVLIEGEIVDEELLKANAEEQGEPVSDYYPAFINAPIIIDTNGFDAITVSENSIQFLGTCTLGFPEGTTVGTPLWAIECFDANSNNIAQLPDNIKEQFPPRRSAYIYRLNQRPPNGKAREDYLWLQEQLKDAKIVPDKPKPPTSLKKNGTVENVIGLTFPEEHSPGEISWGWLFIVAATHPKQVLQNKKQKIISEKFFYYAKVERINKSELNFRIQSLKFLENKTVAVFGLGALGGPSAIEFARNGIGELRLIDHDIVGAGTIVRWPLGASAIGTFKTDAIRKFISENYPYTCVHSLNYRVGVIELRETGNEIHGPSSEEFFAHALDNVSLIYDATAEVGVSHFLSIEARKRNIPFISISATPGVWGGAVMRQLPGPNHGCWMCFQYALNDGSIENPPTNREGDLQAPGCGDISFTGASFELNNIVTAGVRLAMSTLPNDEEGYPDLNGDIAILSLVNDHGNYIFPKWSVYPSIKHPDCPYCKK